MSKTYLATLTPLSPFFFGGSRTFGSGEEANYFAHSEYFPQQTGLLGMLRYYLLKQHGKLNTQDEGTIGKGSFDISTKEQKQEFGKLHGLSPVFLQDKDKKKFIPQPKNSINKKIEENKTRYFLTPVKSRAGTTIFTSTTKEEVFFLEGYTSKEGVGNNLISDDGNEMRSFNYNASHNIQRASGAGNGIFHAIEKTGIKKNREGKPDDQAFYVQTLYKLEQDWSFGCYVSFDDSFSPQADIVPFGGEGTLFSISFGMAIIDAPDKKFLSDFEPLLQSQQELEEDLIKIILLSDAIVPPEVYEHTAFAITETKDFQFIATPKDIDSGNYARLSIENKSNTQPYISAKYNLLKRGSILYCKPEKVIEIETLLNQSNYQHIGFNIFKTIPKHHEQ